MPVVAAGTGYSTGGLELGCRLPAAGGLRFGRPMRAQELSALLDGRVAPWAC
jgi:hypothetical protein